MTVIILENVPPGLRGRLTRWLLEVRAGVFVGTVSGRVRDELWQHVCERKRGGGCLLIHGAANEQGFIVKSHGDTTREIVDLGGLQLVRRS